MMVKKVIGVALATCIVGLLGPAMGANDPGLPTDYTRIEYIQSTGSQYIDTEVTVKDDTTVEADMQLTEVDKSGKGLFGVASDNQRLCLYISGAGAIACCLGNADWKGCGSQPADLNRHTFVLSTWKGGSFSLDGTPYSIDSGYTIPSGKVSSRTIPIGARYYDSKYNCTKCRIYSFRISEGARVAADFVPCRSPDGAAGLYDLKREMFFASKSDVPFYGSDEVRCRSWMRGTGTQWIDTGLMGTTDFDSISMSFSRFVPSTGSNFPVILDDDKWGEGWLINAWPATGGNAKGLTSAWRWFGNTGSAEDFDLNAKGGDCTTDSYTLEIQNKYIKIVNTSKGVTVGENSGSKTTAVKASASNVRLFAVTQTGKPTENAKFDLSHISFSKGDETVANLVPCTDATGAVGMMDLVTGVILPNKGSGAFDCGGIAYLVDGTTNRLFSGEMANDDLTANGAVEFTVIEKVGTDKAFLAAVTDGFPSLVLSEGTGSFVDGERRKHVVRGQLVLRGGATLALDADFSGEGDIDTLEVGACTVDATAENPVRISFRSSGRAQMRGETPLTVIGGGCALEPGDEAKFRLMDTSGNLMVTNGALVLRKRILPYGAEAEWTNGSGDERWNNPANWVGGVVPTNVATFVAQGDYNVTSSDEPSFVGSLVQVGEGDFVHLGETAISIENSITNDSSGDIEFDAPVRLGLDGRDFAISVMTYQNVLFNGEVELFGLLNKTGGGRLIIPADAFRSAPPVSVQAGRLEIGTAAGANGVSNGGRTVIGTSFAVADGAYLQLPAAGTTALAGQIANEGQIDLGENVETWFDGATFSGIGKVAANGGNVWINAMTRGGVPSFASPLNADITLFYKGNASGNEFADLTRQLKMTGRTLHVLGSVAPAYGRALLTGVTWDLGNLSIGTYLQAPGKVADTTSDSYGALTIGKDAKVSVANRLSVGNTAGDQMFDSDLTVGAGGTLEFTGADTNFVIGCSTDWNNSLTRRHVLTVDGGTVDATDRTIQLARHQPHAELVINSGTMTVKGIQFYNGFNITNENTDASITQKGGTLNLGADGFDVNLYKKSNNQYHPYCMFRYARPYADLQGGTLRATADFDTSRYDPTYNLFPCGFMAAFGAEEAGAYTIDLNGHTVNWRTGLKGKSAVTLKGAGRFVSLKGFKGIPTGKWTIGATADLFGAAGFAGGLALAEGVQADIDIGADGAIEMLYQSTDEVYPKGEDENRRIPRGENLTRTTDYTGPYPYVVNSMDRLHLQTGDFDFMWNSFLYRGQFYVEATTNYYFGACFAGNDLVGGCSMYFEIDGEKVLTTNPDGSTIATGNRKLNGGWRNFRVFVFINYGNNGPQRGDWKKVNMALGWTTENPTKPNDAQSYRKFDPSTLRMRVKDGPSAGLGGEILLGAGSTLNNKAEQEQTAGLEWIGGVCPIYGTLSGTGALEGRFAFTSNGVWQVEVCGNTIKKADLTKLGNLGDFLRSIRKVRVLLSERATRMRYELCSAEGLTDDDLKNIVLEVVPDAGAPTTGRDRVIAEGWSLVRDGGTLYLAGPPKRHTLLLIR